MTFKYHTICIRFFKNNNKTKCEFIHYLQFNTWHGMNPKQLLALIRNYKNSYNDILIEFWSSAYQRFQLQN